MGQVTAGHAHVPPQRFPYSQLGPPETPQVTVVRTPRGLSVPWFVGHVEVSLPGSPRAALGPVQGWLEGTGGLVFLGQREDTGQVAPSPNVVLKCRGSKGLVSGQRWCWDKSPGLLNAVLCILVRGRGTLSISWREIS